VAKEPSTGEGNYLKQEELGGIAGYLFKSWQEGIDTEPGESLVLAVQCLRLLEEIPNRDLMVAQLYFIARALARLGRNEESACVLRATAYANRPLEEEPAADNFFSIASLAAFVGAYSLAHHWFMDACRRYMALGLSEKVATCQGEFDRIAPHTTKLDLQTDDNPVELSFLLEGEVMLRLTVTADGEAHWQGISVEDPRATGIVLPWQVRCARL
jgi:hypothetical protein